MLCFNFYCFRLESALLLLSVISSEALHVSLKARLQACFWTSLKKYCFIPCSGWLIKSFPILLLVPSYEVFCKSCIWVFSISIRILDRKLYSRKSMHSSACWAVSVFGQGLVMGWSLPSTLHCLSILHHCAMGLLRFNLFLIFIIKVYTFAVYYNIFVVYYNIL